MKYTYIIAALLALLAPLEAMSQNISLRSRSSLEADWKVSKGLHLSAEYELRTADGLSGVERHQFSLGLSYKLNKHFTAGAGYSYIGHFGSDGSFNPRHRMTVEMSYKLDKGDWRFSVKESLLLTHRAYDFNRFQQTPNALELKSRAKLSYRGSKNIEPYAYVELRNIFNGPSCSATYYSAAGTYGNYEFLGYKDVYVNRLRGAVGVEWKLNGQHSLDFYSMFDHCRDRMTDTNRSGTKLKSIAWESANRASLCIGYKFSF